MREELCEAGEGEGEGAEGEGEGAEGEGEVTRQAVLVALNDCQQLDERVRARATRVMEELLAQGAAMFGEDRRDPEYDWCCLHQGGCEGEGEGEGEAGSYSQTNVQEQGVDEADTVKTDGDYVYVLAQGHLQVFEVSPPEQTQRTGALAIEGEPRHMYVHGDRALVYSSLEPAASGQAWTDPRYGGSRCGTRQSCEYTGDGKLLLLTVVDLSDRSAPEVVRQLRFNGTYLQSRRIGDAVYTVLSFPTALHELWFYPPELDQLCRDWIIHSGDEEPTFEEVPALFEELRRSNRGRLAQMERASWFPSVTEVAWETGEPEAAEPRPLLECSEVLESGAPDGAAVLVLLSQSASGEGPLHAVGVLADRGVVYASHEHLYVAGRHSRLNPAWPWFREDLPDTATTVHRFRLQADPPAATYARSGVLAGHVLNPFSMGEHEGRLHVATQRARHSAVSVLQEQGEQLEVVGEVDNIAPGEVIRSARFAGEIGYLVTYERILGDPLFTLDLSDPAAPRVVGELHIPGYSKYLQLIDPGNLLAVGLDTDEWGSPLGVQLQLFDVADMAAPTRRHHLGIPTRRYPEPALEDHKAITWFAPEGAVALPMLVCDGNDLTLHGVQLYDLSVEHGFSLRGSVAMGESQDLLDERGRGLCSYSWLAASYMAQRALFFPGHLMALSPERLKVQALDALGGELVDLSLVVP